MMLRLSFLLLLLAHSSYSMLLGWVDSPGYPSGYLPHARLNWSRCAPKGHTLSIRLIHLNLEDSHDCEHDAVKIFSNGNLISVLCGKKEFEELESIVNPLLLSSPGSCLSLSFHSDYSNSKRHTGFRGFYSVQDFDECNDPDNQCTQFCHNFIGGYHCSCRHGYHLAEDQHTCTVSCTEDLSGLNKGGISSPSWPGPYAENANCQYTLAVEAHLQLVLHFSDDFDVEQRPDGQCIDSLMIETSSGSFGPFCGHTPPPSPFLTHSNDVRIRFTSDGFGTNKGFRLHFSARDKVCLAAVTPHANVTPQKAEYHPGQTVTVSCHVGYTVNTQGVEALTSQYETTCQRTGIWTPSYPCEIVDCGLPDIPKDDFLQLVGSDNPGRRYEDQIQFNCSSKYYTLEGDDTYICNASGEWVSVGGKPEMPKCTAVCGMPDKLITGVGRILGGENANEGEIPWQLFIRSPKRGGASLINDRWAVTAAHVVDGVDETFLRLFGGLVNGKRSNLPGVSHMCAERIIIHPGYQRIPDDQRVSYDNDIALIRFTSRVNLGPSLLPVCLPTGNSGVSENEIGTVSGWGFTEEEVVSHLLKYAHISVYPVEHCKRTPIMGSKKAMVFTDNMFCAGADNKDSCKGDSGGPFVLPMLSGGRGPFYLSGIVSWGSFCPLGDNKGYYTKVENYVEWIKNTIDTVGNSVTDETTDCRSPQRQNPFQN